MGGGQFSLNENGQGFQNILPHSGKTASNSANGDDRERYTHISNIDIIIIDI